MLYLIMIIFILLFRHLWKVLLSCCCCIGMPESINAMHSGDIDLKNNCNYEINEFTLPLLKQT